MTNLSEYSVNSLQPIQDSRRRPPALLRRTKSFVFQENMILSTSAKLDSFNLESVTVDVPLNGFLPETRIVIYFREIDHIDSKEIMIKTYRSGRNLIVYFFMDKKEVVRHSKEGNSMFKLLSAFLKKNLEYIDPRFFSAVQVTLNFEKSVPMDQQGRMQMLSILLVYYLVENFYYTDIDGTCEGKSPQRCQYLKEIKNAFLQKAVDRRQQVSNVVSMVYENSNKKPKTPVKRRARNSLIPPP